MGVKNRTERVLHVWLLALVIYVLIVPEGNRTFQYYQLPFVPVGAIFIGKTLGRLWDGGTRGEFPSTGTRKTIVCAAIIAMGGLSYVYVAPLFAADPYYRAQYEICREVDALVPKGALMVVGDLDNNADATYRTQAPTLLYYCQRKGWQLLPRDFQDRARLQGLINRGAAYFLVPTHISWDTHQASVSMALYDSKLSKLSSFERHFER